MKPKKKQTVPLKMMRDLILNTYLHGRHGVLGGFRAVRIEDALYDQVQERVVEIRAATYDGGNHEGYNGKRVTLLREEFAKSGCGIEIDRAVTPVDDYVNTLKEQAIARRKNNHDQVKQPAIEPPTEPAADEIGPDGETEFKEDPAPRDRFIEPADVFTSVPALRDEPDFDLKVPPAAWTALKQLLADQPKRLRQRGLPGEPRWRVDCPDGSWLEFAGYGFREPNEPVPSETLLLIAQGSEEGSWAASCMSGKKVQAAIKSLLSPPAAKPGKKKAPPPKAPAETESNYDALFDV